MRPISRLDAKRGRYNPDKETDIIFQAMSAWQGLDGDWIAYYHLDEAKSQIDDVYDEPTGAGLVFHAPVRVEVLHSTDTRGGNEYGDKGFYTNRDLDVKVMFDKFIQAGMSLADIDTENYLKDRVAYDRKIFRVTQIAIEGKMQERNIVVNITGTQLKPDELVLDSVFADWAPGGPYSLVEGTQ
jgi:hypothetical protein